MVWVDSVLKEAEEDFFVSSLDGADEGVSPSRSSSRLSPRARHSSTSDDVVAVNRLRDLEDYEGFDELDVDQLPPILLFFFFFFFFFVFFFFFFFLIFNWTR